MKKEGSVQKRQNLTVGYKLSGMMFRKKIYRCSRMKIAGMDSPSFFSEK
jgi:hypothetical protein